MSNLHPNPLVYEATLVSTDSSSPPQSTTSTSLDDGYHPGDRRAGPGSRAVPPRNVFLRTLSNAQKWFKIEEGDRSCSWGYTASLMTAEFVGLSLLTFPSIFAQLGWLLGLFSIFFIMGCYVYTSTQIGKFCGEHGDVRDVVDIAFVVGGKYGSKARVVTTLFFLMNNIFVMGVHAQAGGQFWNQMNSGFRCVSVTGCMVTVIICLILSSPRSLKLVAVYAFLSVVATVIGCLYQMIVTPRHEGGQFTWRPAPDTTLVSGMVSLLSVAFAFIGQITLPSFIAQMKDPRDFKKALYTSAGLELVVFSIFGCYMYSQVGYEEMESPVIYSIPEQNRGIAWGLMQPTILCLGAIYACVNARFLFTRIFATGSVHYGNTCLGWTTWLLLLCTCWALAFTIAQTIPEFESLLALIGAIFDAFFGYIYWGILWIYMARNTLLPTGQPRRTPIPLRQIINRRPAEATFNIFLIAIGLGIFLGLGTWASLTHIIASFQKGEIRAPFSCYYGSEGCS